MEQFDVEGPPKQVSFHCFVSQLDHAATLYQCIGNHVIMNFYSPNTGRHTHHTW